jgi:phosphoglycolate phosphatase-like HAD superfamily hydrolase
VKRPAIFLDDGGVMNENDRRGPQWQRLVGRYFIPRLGGAPEAWGRANREVATRLFEASNTFFDADPTASFAAFDARYKCDWLVGMCEMVGVASPPDPDEQRRLAHACDCYATRRVRSAYPGAISAIRRLHAAGYVLRTASGETSWELDGYLTGMRVRDCFVALYGPDVVDTAKASPLYHRRVLEHAGIAPADALVVDDSERVLAWAADLGAATVLCRVEPPTDPRHRHVRRLAELPRLLGC